MVTFCVPVIDSCIMDLLNKRSRSSNGLLCTQSLSRVFVAFVKQRVRDIVRVSPSLEVCDEHSASSFYRLTLKRCFSDAYVDFCESMKKIVKVEPSTEEEKCPICLCGGCDMQIKCCNNAYHMDCLAQCLLAGITQCPLCRKENNMCS